MTRARTLLCMAALLCISQVASAQGPLRRAARGAAEVTGDAARGAAEVTGDAARATARGVGAVTPGVPAEAHSGGPAEWNAGWRTQRHNGDYWYYSPDNSWMVYRNNTWIPYSADTFVPNQQYANDGQSSGNQQMVFIDSGGRAVICQNGRVTFVDGTALQSVSRSQVNAQGYLIQQGSVQGQIQSQQSYGTASQSQTRVQQSAAGQVNGRLNSQLPGVQTQGLLPGRASGQGGPNFGNPPAAPSPSAGLSGEASGSASGSSFGDSSANDNPGAESGDATDPNGNSR